MTWKYDFFLQVASMVVTWWILAFCAWKNEESNLIPVIPQYVTPFISFVSNLLSICYPFTIFKCNIWSSYLVHTNKEVSCESGQSFPVTQHDMHGILKNPENRFTSLVYLMQQFGSRDCYLSQIKTAVIGTWWNEKSTEEMRLEGCFSMPR